MYKDKLTTSKVIKENFWADVECGIGSNDKTFCRLGC
jgi:hypothetical protein